MFGIRILLISLAGFITIFSKSDAYLTDRSAAFSLEKLPLPLSLSQNISYEKVLNNNTNTIKTETISDDKIGVKPLEKTASKEDVMKENFETISDDTEKLFMTKHNDTSFKTNSHSPHLKNIILIFVDVVKQEREEFRQNLERFYNFPVHNYFKVKNVDENGPMKISLNKVLFIGNKKEEEECKDTLRSDIRELLIWATHVHGMATNVLSTVNFSIPVSPGMEETFEIIQNNESGETGKKGAAIRKRQLQQKDLTHLMDTYESKSSDSPIVITSNAEKENTENYDDMWDVLDMFSKIRIAFFRAMMDTFGGSYNKRMAEDEFSSQELQHSKPSFVSLVGESLQKLERTSGDEGYFLVLVMSDSELVSVIDLLHHEVSQSDTLLVVSEICTKDVNQVSFFAEGPESLTFNQMRTIGDLSDVVKSVVGRAYQVRGCNKNRHRNYGVPIRVIRHAIILKNHSVENEPSNQAYSGMPEIVKLSDLSSATSNNLNALLSIAMPLLGLITVSP